MSVALDASAVLALLFDEPGAENVRPRLAGAAMSAVNLSESYAKMLEAGFEPEDAHAALTGLTLKITEFDEEMGYRAGALRLPTRNLGLSFADRACLALALREGVPALTADRKWAELDIGVEIEVIR